jgi:hypothetical protein
MDVIWEYQGLHAAKPAEIESEDILLEMERLVCEDIREEVIRKRVVPITSVIHLFFHSHCLLTSNLFAHLIAGV